MFSLFSIKKEQELYMRKQTALNKFNKTTKTRYLSLVS